MRPRNLIIAGLSAITLATAPFPSEQLNESESKFYKMLRPSMTIAGMVETITNRSIDILLGTIKQAELDEKYKDSVNIRTAHDPPGKLESTALHPYGLLESTHDLFYFTGAILPRDQRKVVLKDDYKTLNPVYERMKSKHKKAGNLDYHIDYGEEANLTQEEKISYERTCRRITEFMWVNNEFDFDFTIAEWRWGLAEATRLHGTPRLLDSDKRYFRIAYNCLGNSLSLKT